MVGLVRPLILSGGSGARLWPLSRQAYPKQFLPLIDEVSLFQRTCKRVEDSLFLAPDILCNDSHRFIAAEQMMQIGVKPNAIVLEPVGRNTAPAVLVASMLAARENEDQLLLFLPSDQIIDDQEEFVESIKNGLEDAKSGNVVVFGIEPTSPHTGYGYIKTKPNSAKVLDVEAFVEKPNKKIAQTYLDSGGYFWNAGIFLFTAKAMLKAFKAHAPEMLKSCEAALDKAVSDLDFVRLDSESYGKCKNISLDYAVMERSSNRKCVPLGSKWSDLGSWAAVSEQGSVDSKGNVAKGDVIFQDSRDSYAYSADGATIAVVGLENIAVVATKDAILVASKERTEEVKDVVETLKNSNANSVTYHSRVYRPWGWYEGLERGERFQVKCLMVKPGEVLSLQSHCHRSEHWVVVNGTARVTIDESVKMLTENESVYIPLGAKHRLENPGQIPALLVEVQTGSYLGEDDIERFEDLYGRGIVD